MRHSLRSRVFLRFVPTLLVMLTACVIAACDRGGLQSQGNHVVFIMGGDVEYARTSRPPTVLYHVDDKSPDRGPAMYGQFLDVRNQVTGDWPLIPYLNEGEGKTHVESLGLAGLGPHVGNRNPMGTPPSSITKTTDEGRLPYDRNPMEGLTSTLKAADLNLFNLETALTDHARHAGLIITPERFATDLRSAGVGLVTVANNHTFDAEGQGFLDTLRALSSAGVAYVGGGNDLAEARKPFVFERNGIKVGILGYAQFSNMGEPAFAAHGRPGIAPMDPFVIKADIRRLRPQVNYVAVTMHWATNSGTGRVSPENRSFAHDLIDAGADMILGHHPPLPKGIEVYRGKVIIYSPSVTLRRGSMGSRDAKLNNSPDNYLVRFTLGAKSVERVEVLPIAGKGQMPFPLEGARARELLEVVRSRSAELGTPMTIDGDRGLITIPPTSN